ncbi:MAG: PGPGW domain-containing protein [Planctomycetes bacterium]|nr:PGPGW domain-containing protein [Planctomycetota bacterium]
MGRKESLMDPRDHYSFRVGHSSNSVWRVARKIAVLVVGGTITIVGILLVVLPGPAFVVIPAGLAILATEFDWAKAWLIKAKEVSRKAMKKVRR